MTDFHKEHLLARFRTALEKIATGEIVGEPRNHRDTLAICRDIAREALAPDLSASAGADVKDDGVGT